MKFNWGHGIFIVIVIGITGFLSLLYITTRERIDMVTEDYYPKELKYEDQIIKTKNYNALREKVIVKVEDQVSINFPKQLGTAQQITGLVHFYRPSDKLLDVETELVLNDSYAMFFDKENFKEGKYEVIIEWQAGEKPFFTKLDLYID